MSFLRRSLGPSEVAWLAQVLERERAQVCHLHTFASQVVGTRAGLRGKVRLLRTEHSTRAYDDATCWPFSRWSLARVDACVAVSEHVRTAVVARAPWAAERVRVVPNGVDVERFSPREGARADRFAFVIVGRLEPRKGVDVAIAAMAEVPDATLDVAGDGESRNALEELARRRRVSDRVRFHGFVDDPRDLLARSDAALCTSRKEGFGMALLEAMAMGRPVVGYAVGGVPEVVAHGSTGLLAPAGDVEGLVARMREAVAARDRTRALGEGARAWVVERFSVRSMCAAYGRAYAALAGGANLSPP